MGRVTVAGGKPAMEAPSAGIALSTLAEGSIVKLNEDGSPVEFYVAKHNYESGLNGTGRTLLVRRYTHSNQVWGISVNAYASSGLNTWMNGAYRGLLDTKVQKAIGTTKFYYTPGNGTTSVTTLERSVFALSMTELGPPTSTVKIYNTEGSALPIASLLEIAYTSRGNATSQWVRTPRTNSTNVMYYVSSNGVANGNIIASETTQYAARPCFTLPANALFDEETLEFKGVA
jgi:hypothetical protein